MAAIRKAGGAESANLKEVEDNVSEASENDDFDDVATRFRNELDRNRQFLESDSEEEDGDEDSEEWE